MNQQQLQTKRNNTRRLFRHTSGIHVNCIRINTSNSFEHELKKFRMAWALAMAGRDFLTEAETPDKKVRCDLVDLDYGRAIEVACSEKEESLIKKSKTYPLPITIVRVKEEIQ